MPYEVDPTLVRGIDYYTRTVFEFESERLGAQAALGGGGRYDGLIEQLGGPATPGVGWALGVERMLLAAAAGAAADGPADGGPDEASRADVFVAVASPEAARDAFLFAERLRTAGLRAELEQAGRSMKGQLKQANRVGARATVIVGDGIEVKDMRDGAQQPAADAGRALQLVYEVLER
jgi:histidyl-tRNA synthetase